MVDSRPGPTVACDGVLLSELPSSACTNLVTCYTWVPKNMCISREFASVGADLSKQNLIYNTYDLEYECLLEAGHHQPRRQDGGKGWETLASVSRYRCGAQGGRAKRKGGKRGRVAGEEESALPTSESQRDK